MWCSSSRRLGGSRGGVVRRRWRWRWRWRGRRWRRGRRRLCGDVRPGGAVRVGARRGRVGRRGPAGRRRLAGALVPRRPVSGHPCARCVGRGRGRPRGPDARGGCIGRPSRHGAVRVPLRRPRTGPSWSIWRPRWWDRRDRPDADRREPGRLERWRLVGDRLERQQLDDRRVEYPRMDQTCEGQVFRYGYAVELVATPGTSRFDLRVRLDFRFRVGSGFESGSALSRF